MTNEELVALIQSGTDKTKNMPALYFQMKGAIYQIAKKYSGMEDMEDLTQEGYIALCKAVECYQPDNGTSFVSYAWKCIQRHLIRYTRKDGPIPIHMLELMGKYKKLENTFRLQCARKPTDHEISYYLQISDKQIKQLKCALCAGQMASLDAPIGEEYSLRDTLADDTEMESDALEKVQQEQIKTVLWNAVDSLPDHQPEIIRKRYQENMTRQQIGNSLGVTKEKAWMLENRALRLLRNPGRNKELQSFKEEYITTHAFHGSGAETFKRTWTSSTERAALKLYENY